MPILGVGHFIDSDLAKSQTDDRSKIIEAEGSIPIASALVAWPAKRINTLMG